MNNEQQQIIDEAYKNYSKEYAKDNSIGTFLPIARVDGKHTYRKLDEERFIGLCIHDETFSGKWGLKIEERELSLEERCDEYIKRHPKETNDGVLNYKWIGDNLCTHEDYDKWNIPTKLIIITYKEQTITSYE